MKNNRKNAFLAVIICTLLVVSLSGTAASADIVLGRGESRILPVQNLVRVAVADPEIADVLVVNNTDLLITAKSLGTTTIHLWEKSGRTSYSLRVVTKTEDLARELEDLIGISSVQVRIVEDTVIVDGVVHSEAAHKRAIKAAEAYGSHIIDLITVRTSENMAAPKPFRSDDFPASDDASVLQWLEELIGLDTVKLRLIADVLFIEGEVSSELEKAKVEAIAEAAGFEYKSFLTVVPQEPAPHGDSKEVAEEIEGETVELTVAAEKIQRFLADSRLQIYTVNDWLFLEGQVSTPYEKIRAEKIAGAFVADNRLVSLIQVTPQDSHAHDAPGIGENTKTAAPMERSDRPGSTTRETAPTDKVEKTEVVEPVASIEVSGKQQSDTTVQEQKSLEELEQRIRSVMIYPGVRVQIVEQTVILSGQVTDESHIGKAQQLAEIFGLPVVNLLSVVETEVEEPSRTEEIAALIGIESVQVTEVGGRILLEGHVQTQLEYNRAERIASLYSTEVVNLLRVDEPQQVLLQIKVMEASKTAMEKLGITWGSLSPVFTPHIAYLGQNDVFGPVEFLSRLGGEIEVLLKTGEARILAKPAILTLSGKEASFLAGGEIPVVVPRGGETAIEWKTYGVKLDVTPVVESSGQITVTLCPEVSSLDWANAVKLATTSIPALKTRRTSTTVSLTDGGTLALSGLIQNTESKQIDKVPLLGDLPIIGALFRSEQFQQEETELIFLVTCKVISGPADWATAAEMKLLPQQGGPTDE